MKEILLKIQEKSTSRRQTDTRSPPCHQNLTSAKKPSSYPLLSKHKHFVKGKFSYCWLSFLLVVFMSLEESLRVVKIGILRAKCRILGAKSGYSSLSLQSWVPGQPCYKVALVESSNVQIIGGAIFTALLSVEKPAITAPCHICKHS